MKKRTRIIEFNSPSFLRKALSTQNWHKDGSIWQNHEFRSSNKEDTDKQTLATSSPILTNGSSRAIRAWKDVTRFCWFDRVSEILVKVSDASETRGRKSFCADVWACSIALPATADVESCVTRTNSRAGLGFPFLSTKDRTTSKLSSYQSWPGQPTARCYLPSFGCNCWSLSSCSSSMSILPRHLTPNTLSCNTVMMILDKLCKKGLQSVSSMLTRRDEGWQV